MSAPKFNRPRPPLSPQTIQARILVIVLAVAFLVALVLPWVATAGSL